MSNDTNKTTCDACELEIEDNQKDVGHDCNLHEWCIALDEYTREQLEEAHVNKIIECARLNNDLQCEKIFNNSSHKLITDRDTIIEKLRAFANELMDEWPGGSFDGGDLQDIAERHGLLKPTTQHQPCCELCQKNESHENCSCACTEYYSSEEWVAGITCYRKTPLLTGAS